MPNKRNPRNLNVQKKHKPKRQKKPEPKDEDDLPTQVWQKLNTFFSALDKDDDSAFNTLGYAGDLNEALVYLWFPLKLAWRVPFRVTYSRKRRSLEVNVRRRSIWFITSYLMTALLWVVFIWLTFGLISIFYEKVPEQTLHGMLLPDGSCEAIVRNASSGPKLVKYNTSGMMCDIENPKYTIRNLEKDLLRRYFPNVFVLWTILFHASVASIHLLTTCEDHAAFVRDWYKAVDRGMLRAAKGMKCYILFNLFIIVGLSCILVLAFWDSRILPGIKGSATVMVVAMTRPLISVEKLLADRAGDKNFYFERLAPIGLGLCIFAMISSRLNLLFFMVMCRIFRRCSYLINRRIEMALGQRKIKGENAVHVDYVNLYKDHVQISALGKKIGDVFGTTIVFYYAIQMVCITVEMSSLVYFDFHVGNDEFLPGTSIRVADEPEFLILNAVCHLVISIGSFLFMSLEAAKAGEEAMRAIDMVRQQGLIFSINEKERRYVQTMCNSGSFRNPILIRPGHMFILNRQFIFDVLAVCFFYFILMWQFRHNANVEKRRAEKTGSAHPRLQEN